LIAIHNRREDPSDAIVLRSDLQLDNAFDIISGNNDSNPVTIGTSSLRRIAQLNELNSKINISDIRGN